MIDLGEWKPLAMAALREAFGERLLCMGLQGSYLRGEVRPDSDIDLLVVLDHVDLTDLDHFHEAMRTVPEGDKAVGFTCGRDELAAWPAYELAQFEHGTQVWHGNLCALLPAYGPADVRLDARVSVANLYHMTNHTYLTTRELSADARLDALRAMLKGFFFSLQIVHAVRAGVFVPTKCELLAALDDPSEHMLLAHSIDPSEAREEDYSTLQQWCSAVMRSL